MAWQLIYTSAPRLLEAGRSGFGTVARHRAIPGLLAGAIERVSQFSRLPGLAEHRIIYSHRHITAGGARYHVISRICDSGADYTGRTNHLAHHLIIEAREAAAAGVSPGDVMLSFPWKSRWDEAPRYFEATEEISLTTIPRTIRLPARWWERMTTNARYAALLTAPEVSRGCYLIYAGDTQRDAQQQTAILLFGESLLLATGRTWAIPFTTNLQPSDESGDFLWSGVWADSPVRNQAEQSERVVFYLDGGAIRKRLEGTPPVPRGPASDLAATGQGAEAPKAAAAIPVENAAPAAGKPFLPQAPETARASIIPSPYPAAKMPLPPASRPSSGTKFPWVLVTGMVAGVVLLSGLGFFISKKMQKNEELAAIVNKELSRVPGHKDSDPGELLSQIGNGRTQEQVRNIAATAQDLALKWVDALATTAESKDAQIKEDVSSLQGVTQPESILAFVKRVQDWLDLRDKVLRRKITDEKSYEDYAALCNDPLMQSAAVDSMRIRDALLQESAERRVAFLLDALQTKPSESLAWFRAQIDGIPKDVPALKDNLATLNKIVTLWTALEKSLNDNQPSQELAKDHFHENPLAPAWLAEAVNAALKPKENAITAVATPAPEEVHGLVTLPVAVTDEDKVKNGSKTIYMVVGDEGLATLQLPFDPGKLSKLTLVTNDDASVDLEHFDPNYFKDKKCWFQFSSGNLEHIPSRVSEDKELQPSPPYVLKGTTNEDPQGTGKDFEIKVFGSAAIPQSTPLLRFQGGLTIKQDKTCVITYDKGFEKLAANVVFPPDAKLKPPANFNPTGEVPASFDFSKYRADISKLMNDLVDKKKKLESLVAASKPGGDNSSYDPAKDVENEIKKQLQDLNKSLKTDALKKLLPAGDQPPSETINSLINLSRTINDKRGDKEKKAFDEDIKLLQQAIASIQKLNPPSPQNPVSDEAAQQRDKSELDAITKSPLLDGKLPGGSYSVVVGDAGHEIILAEFDIPNPEAKNK